MNSPEPIGRLPIPAPKDAERTSEPLEAPECDVDLKPGEFRRLLMRYKNMRPVSVS